MTKKEILSTEPQEMKPISVSDVTKSMGFCACGDCRVRVYADGSYEYEGSCKWQRSKRQTPIVRGLVNHMILDVQEFEPRDFNSELTVEYYLLLWEKACHKALERIQKIRECRNGDRDVDCYDHDYKH